MSPIDLQAAARDHAQSSVPGDRACPEEPNALERMRFPNRGDASAGALVCSAVFLRCMRFLGYVGARCTSSFPDGWEAAYNANRRAADS